MTFFLLGLIAHVLADFVFQSDAMASQKAGTDYALFSHGAVVLVCSAVAFHPFGWGVSVVLAGFLAAAHLLIDRVRTAFDDKVSPFGRLLLFAGDQVLHVTVIVTAWQVARPAVSANVAEFYSSSFLPAVMSAFRPHFIRANLTLNRALAVVLAYLFVIFAGAQIVRCILDAFSVQVEPKLATNAGRYIGMLERTLMLTLVLVNALPSIAFVLAAKSLARFRELGEMKFAEYYLIGTLSSSCIAVITGLLTRWALGAV